MDVVELSTWILREEKIHISNRVENMTKIVHKIEDVVLRVVSILDHYNVVEMVKGVLSRVPAMESDRMELLRNLGHKKQIVKNVVDILKEILCLHYGTSHIDYIFCIGHEILRQ